MKASASVTFRSSSVQLSPHDCRTHAQPRQYAFVALPSGFAPSAHAHEDWSGRPLRGRDVLFSRVIGPLTLRNAVVNGHADQVPSLLMHAQPFSYALALQSSIRNHSQINATLLKRPREANNITPTKQLADLDCGVYVSAPVDGSVPPVLSEAKDEPSVSRYWHAVALPRTDMCPSTFTTAVGG